MSKCYRFFLIVVMIAVWLVHLSYAAQMPITVPAPLSQAGMNAQSGKTLACLQKQLDSLYLTIRKKYEHNAAFLAKLATAQQAWQQYSHAQLDMIYPPSGGRGASYPTILPFCLNQLLITLTKERIHLLMFLIQPEGDVCSLSYR